MVKNCTSSIWCGNFWFQTCDANTKLSSHMVVMTNKHMMYVHNCKYDNLAYFDFNYLNTFLTELNNDAIGQSLKNTSYMKDLAL